MKELLKVGYVSKIFETIPVGVILDFYYDCKLCELAISEHFRMIEADGVFIVSVESFFVHTTPEIIYKGFTTIEDAYEYLDMYGVTDECKKETNHKNRNYDS